MGEQYVKKIAPGFNLHINREPKFKTTTIKLSLIRNIDEQTTWGVLLSKVLQRGTQAFPTALLLEQALEDNYGSRLTIRARKIGEHQLIEITLQLPNAKYLNCDENIFERGLYFIEQILYNPQFQEGYLHADYVEQEKQVLQQEIESVFNDKESWAMQRCIELSCENEPFAIPAYGRLTDIPAITPKNLTEFYRELINTAPIEVFVVGDVVSQEVEKLFRKTIKVRKQSAIASVTQRTLQKDPIVERIVIEKDDLFQGKLIMSLRSKISPLSNQLPAHILFNSILGGGTHSKIFNTVREAHSLAYYAHSGMQRNKQMVFIEAGIELDKFEAATKLIKQCWQDLVDGQISDSELEQAKTSLINYLWSLEDYSGGGIEYEMTGLLAGRSWSVSEMEEAINKVTLIEVQNAAQHSTFDTVYFLSPQGGSADE